MGWIKRLSAETVVVHLTTGASIRGVMTGVHRDCLVLVHGAYLGTESVETVDGEIVVPRERVAWIQHLGGVSP